VFIKERFQFLCQLGKVFSRTSVIVTLWEKRGRTTTKNSATLLRFRWRKNSNCGPHNEHFYLLPEVFVARKTKKLKKCDSLIANRITKEKRIGRHLSLLNGRESRVHVKMASFFGFSSHLFLFKFVSFSLVFIRKSFHKSFYTFCVVVVLRHTTTQIGRGSGCCCHDSFTLFCGFALIIQMRCRHGVRRFLNIGRKRRNKKRRIV